MDKDKIEQILYVVKKIKVTKENKEDIIYFIGQQFLEIINN